MTLLIISLFALGGAIVIIIAQYLSDHKLRQVYERVGVMQEAEILTLRKLVETKNKFIKSTQAVMEKQGAEITRLKDILTEALGGQPLGDEAEELSTAQLLREIADTIDCLDE